MLVDSDLHEAIFSLKDVNILEARLYNHEKLLK